MQTVYPEQRVSSKTKLKEDWYINNAKYWLSQGLKANNKTSTQKNIDAANGVVDKETYRYVLKPLSGTSSTGDELKNLPGEIRDIDFITPIKEKNIGEYIDLPYNYLVKVNDPEIAILRSTEVAEMVRPIVEQYIINKINEFQQTDVPSVPIEQLETEITKLKESWFDKRTTHVSNLIEYVNDYNNFEDLRIQGFYDWWSTEEVYFHLFISKGQFFVENIHPLEGYPILAGHDNTEEGDGFVIKRKLSIFEVESCYGDRLSTKDRKYLKSILNIASNETAPYSIPAEIYKDSYGRRLVKEDSNYYSDNENYSIDSSIFNEFIIYFKTEVRQNIVTRLNELGVVLEEIVDEDYELNIDAGDIDLRKEWIEEVWQQVLIGDIHHGIYLKPEPVPLQIYDGKGRVYLPTVGRTRLLKGISNNPIPKRLLPSIAFHRILNLQIERHIAKYKAPVELIPKGLLTSVDGSPKDAMFYKLADNTIIYDETKFTGAELDRAYKIIGNSGVSSFIKDLIDLRDRVKMEAWDLANMNDARYGNTPASATVRNNEQNIYRAKLGSILMTTIYNNILSRVHKLSAEYANLVYQDGLSGTIFDKNVNKVKHFNIPGGVLNNVDLGIFVVNSVIEKQKLEEYKELAFSAGQHGEFGLASEAIDGKDVSTIRESIKEYIAKKEAFEKEAAERDRESNQMVAQTNQETEQMKAENRLEEIRLKEELAKDREMAVASIKSNNSNN